VLALHHLSIPASMDGRVLCELMINQPEEKNKIKQETIATKIIYDWGTYELQLKITKYGKYSYVDYSNVKRKFSFAISKADY
jgi:hypothetical protein